MRVIVDRMQCEANRRCELLAPEVFYVDDDDQLHLRIEEPGPALLAGVREAVERCPKRALELLDISSAATQSPGQRPSSNGGSRS